MSDKNLIDTAHDLANDLYSVGAIDIVTMREYDALCLKPVRDFKPKEIKAIRINEKVSQAVFAKYLNTTTSTVKQWEQGEKHPRGTSLKLLNLVHNHGLSILQ